jgi:hypothetical protein
MGYGFYMVDRRPAGYMVLATCDRRGCDAEIDRGMGYLCGAEPGQGHAEPGCGRYYCEDHEGWIGSRGGCTHRGRKAWGRTLSCMAENADGSVVCLDRAGHDTPHACTPRGTIRVRTPDDKPGHWTATGDLVPGRPYSYISGDVAVLVDWPEPSSTPVEAREAADRLWDEWYHDEDMNGSGRVLHRHFRPLIEAALAAIQATPEPGSPDGAGCRYECPLTEDGHAAMDADHEYVR